MHNAQLGVGLESQSDDIVVNPVRLSEARECGGVEHPKSECRRHDVVTQLHS